MQAGLRGFSPVRLTKVGLWLSCPGMNWEKGAVSHSVPFNSQKQFEVMLHQSLLKMLR